MNDKWYQLGDHDGELYPKGSTELYWVTPVWIDNTGRKCRDAAYATKIKGDPIMRAGETVTPLWDGPRRTDGLTTERPRPSKTPYTRTWPRKVKTPPKPDPVITPLIKEDFDMFWLRKIWHGLLRFIDWLNSRMGATEVKPKRKNNYQTLLVQKHHGIQVKHWHQYLFWVDVISGFDDNDKPILSGKQLAVSQWDSDGHGFYPEGVFEIQRNPSKLNRVPYEWQPIAPKHHQSVKQILYGHVPEWFEAEMRSRPRNEREDFYHPPPEVAHTPYEWIDGEISGRKYGAWCPVEQMATLGELFEGHEESDPDELPGWAVMMKVQVEQHMRQQQTELGQRRVDRERGTDHVIGG